MSEFPLVLLLHGQPGTRSVWRDLGARLDPDLRTLAVDRPGYGTNPAPATGVTGNAAYVRHLLDTESVDRAVLVAHSWAGAPALRAALTDDRIVGLVLIAPAGGPGSVGLADRILARPNLGGRLVHLGVAFGRWLLRRPRLARAFFADLAVLPLSGLAHFRRLLRDQRTADSFLVEQQALVAELPDLVRDLRDIDCPVLIVSGDADLLVPLRVSRRLAAATPGARLVVIPRARHVLPITHAAQLAELVRSFAARFATTPQTG